jgi:RNA polymerase sigma-70 factor (ECF subfamily)
MLWENSHPPSENFKLESGRQQIGGTGSKVGYRTLDDPALRTQSMHHLVDRIQAGDAPARDELLRRVMGRMERLTRSMLRSFHGVRGWEETGDVLQNALMRLLRTLQKLRPDDTRGFFHLAAEHIRRELIDLNRHYQGALGHGRNLALGDFGEVDGQSAKIAPPADPAPGEDHLERWRNFHEAAGALEGEQREVFSLAFYHGWTQPQIAELLGVHERTVRRAWRAACLRLAEEVGGDLPLD